MTLTEKLYYCMCIKANDYRYNFGRQANKTLKDIDVPAIVPLWAGDIFENAVKTNVTLLQNLV